MGILIKIAIGIVVICFIVMIINILKANSQKSLEKQLTKMGNAVARAQNNIINNNEEILRETANKTADIQKDAVKTIVHSVKEGFTEENDIYCKHCGASIDYDSKFCKSCGKEQ